MLTQAMTGGKTGGRIGGRTGGKTDKRTGGRQVVELVGGQVRRQMEEQVTG